MFINALEQACLIAPLVFSIYLSYTILKITDLATEGSFLLGATVFSITIHAQYNLFVSMLFAIISGACSGIITNILQRILGFSDLISGILTLFFLHAFCLKIMGRPNMNLFDKPSLITLFPSTYNEAYLKIGCLGGIAMATFAILSKLLTSKIGLTLRALGNNALLLEFFGKSSTKYYFIGLMTSNALSALAGSITAQIQGFADIGMGTGIVLISLSAVLIGESLCELLFRKYSTNISLQLFSSFLGILFYFFILHMLISIGIDPINLKMVTTFFVVCTLYVNRGSISKNFLRSVS